MIIDLYLQHLTRQTYAHIHPNYTMNPNLTPGATSGAVVFWVQPQVVSHVVCSPRLEVTGGTLQQKYTEKTHVII